MSLSLSPASVSCSTRHLIANIHVINFTLCVSQTGQDNIRKLLLRYLSVIDFVRSNYYFEKKLPSFEFFRVSPAFYSVSNFLKDAFELRSFLCQIQLLKVVGSSFYGDTVYIIFMEQLLHAGVTYFVGQRQCCAAVLVDYGPHFRNFLYRNSLPIFQQIFLQYD